MEKKFLEDYAKVQRGFQRVEKNGLAWASAPMLTAAGVKHGCTTRRGGVSTTAGMDSLNLGWNRQQDSRENVTENYSRLGAAAGFAYDSMALVAYEHGGNVCLAKGEDKGKGFGKGTFPPCDGLITSDPSVTLITLHADCMPVFLYEPVIKGGAMLHAGWKGTVLRIGQRAVEQICAELSGKAPEVLAAVGPCICREHFEVDAPVVHQFRQAFSDVAELDTLPWVEHRSETDKFHIDLACIMALQLMLAGVRPENITIADECTYRQREDYYSYRRDGKPCGAMAGFLQIEN